MRDALSIIIWVCWSFIVGWALKDNALNHTVQHGIVIIIILIGLFNAFDYLTKATLWVIDLFGASND